MDLPEVEDTLATRIRAIIMTKIMQTLVIIITKTLRITITRGIITVPSIEEEDAGDVEITGAEAITSPNLHGGMRTWDSLMEVP